jgi:hypothetical protein
MSGDETDHCHGQTRYAILKARWRSPDVKTFMKTLDSIHFSSRFNSAGRAKRGAFPHRRVPSSRIEHDAAPVPNLPCNFYDPILLKSLSKHERDALQIKPEVDLTMTEGVIRWGLLAPISMQ